MIDHRHPLHHLSRRALVAGGAVWLALAGRTQGQDGTQDGTQDGAQERPPERIQERPPDRPGAVLAAASLRPVLDEIMGLSAAASGLRTTVTYGASDALVQQLAQGAAADLFISDVRAAMDFAIEHGLVKAETRRSLAANRLVLVAPKDSNLIEVLLGPGTRLSALAGQGRIAAGDAETLPAGAARSALESLGLWADAESRLSTAETSRDAAALVGRGEAPLGIVFVSDARFEPAVKVVGVFPETSHPPVVYEAGVTMAAGINAPALLDFLQSAAARAAFEKAGYLTMK